MRKVLKRMYFSQQQTYFSTALHQNLDGHCLQPCLSHYHNGLMCCSITQEIQGKRDCFHQGSLLFY